MNDYALTKQFWGKPSAKSKACCYCGLVLDRSQITSEHIVPKSKGGRITAPCCLACNRQKADMLLIDFIILLMSQRPDMVKPKVLKRCDTKIGNAVKYLLILYPGDYDFIFVN